MSFYHADFFDKARSIFRNGQIVQSQVDGVNLILDECAQEDLPRQQVATVLATGFWETGQRMQPVREGFATTDSGAIRAVTSLYKAGRISTNYALPHSKTGESYYGRGLVQLTWYDNYLRMGKLLEIDLVGNPDLALDPVVSVRILVEGMKRGLFTGVSLDKVSEPRTSLNFVNDRAVVNGKDRAVEIANIAKKFDDALVTWPKVFGEQTVDLPAPEGLTEEDVRRIVREELTDSSLSIVVNNVTGV